MNLLGKIFVVLILVMSLVFMGFAVAVFATHKNWQAIVMLPQSEVKPGEPLGLKYQLEAAEAKNKELQAKFDNVQGALAREQAAKRQQLAKLETEKEQLRKEYEQLVNNEAKVDEERRQALAATKEAQDMLDAKLKEIDLLRQDLAKAYSERDDHFKQSVAITDDLHQAQGELDRLKTKNVQLAEQTAKAKVAMDRAGVSIEEALASSHKLDGLVLKSSKDQVEVSLGSDDGLTRGQVLIVYRLSGGTSKYLGKVEVLETQPDRSVAKIIPEFRKGPIEKEDRVATRFN